MIRILNLIDTGGPGGAETVFLHTATGLDPQQFASVPVISRDGWLASQVRDRGVTPVILSASGSFHFSYLFALRRLARQQRVNVILAHLYGSAVYGTLLGLLTGVPVICVLHGQVDIPRTSRLAGLKAAIVRRGARKVVFVSDKLADSLQTQLKLPATKRAVIANGVDTAAFIPDRQAALRQQLGLSAATVLLGSIGNIRPAKAYEVLLEAAAILVGRGHAVHFAVAGEGSGSLYKRLLELRTRLGLDDKVTFLGLRPDVAQVLNGLDLYVLSSTTEGFSIACIEAMACGVPVVATRSGGPEQIIEHDRSGVLVPAGDPAALADGIESLLLDRQKATRLADAALIEVRKRFSLGTMLKAYERLLQSTAAIRQ